MVKVLWVILVVASGFFHAEGCGTNNVVCLSYTTYQYCVTSGTQIVLINGIHTCANGTLCQENSTYICTNAADVVITTSTTTVAPVTPPAECNSVSVYPASNCSQYYECSSYLWLWYSLNLVSCPSGQAFNRASLTCTSDSSCNAATGEFVTTPMPTTTPPITTTTAAPVTPPASCTSVSVYPAQNCSQYYECSSYLWVWYSLNLVSCPSGQAFNRTSLVCVSDSSCDRATGEFITTPVPTTTTPVPTTTTAAPTTTTTPITTTTTASVTPPTCNSVSVYPAANCSQYYECSSYLWLWYSLNLVSCPSGQAFNSTQLKCVVDSSCDRQTGIYTTLAMTTASTTVPTTASTTVTTTKSTSPTTVSTAVPTTASTTVTTTKSTTAPTTAASTTVPTTAASTTVPTTAASTTVPTTASTAVPTTASTAVPTTAPTAVPTTASTAVPTTASTAVPTTASTIVPTTASTVNTTVAITTTTAPVTPPAECTSVSVYPAPNCSQYYECSSYLWIWYSLNLLSCPSGQAFNSTQLKCVADSSCDPVTGKFTTTAITTATTPSLPL